jgi:hypothetical protein
MPTVRGLSARIAFKHARPLRSSTGALGPARGLKQQHISGCLLARRASHRPLRVSSNPRQQALSQSSSAMLV